MNRYSTNLLRLNLYSTMSKKGKSKGGKSQVKTPKVEDDVIFLDKSNNIVVQVLAKPGAKQNGITGITPEGVGIQINAPPAEGEANTELVKYFASVLGLRKSDVVFDKGFKSRSKTLRVTAKMTVDDVRKKLWKKFHREATLIPN